MSDRELALRHHLRRLRYVANRAMARLDVSCRRIMWLAATRSRGLKVLRDKQQDSATVVYRALQGDEVSHLPGISNVRPPYSRMVGTYSLPEAEVLVKHNVVLLGKFATPIDEHGCVLGYSVVPNNYREFLWHTDMRAIYGACNLPRLQTTLCVDLACSLVNGWSTSYYHWVVEVLPRIVLLLTADAITEDTWIVVDRRPTKWQLRSLQLLGVSGRIVQAGNSIRVARLLIPDFPRSVPAGLSFSVLRPSMLQDMKTRITRACNANTRGGTEDVFISRASSIGRRILNEEELIEGLAKLGFTSYRLEEMSFDEQVRLFARADRIVGPHGAGLANMVWSTGSRVCEIYGAGWNPSFYTLANAMGIEYALYRCRPARSISPKRADLVVDVGDFVEFVARHMPKDRDGEQG